MQHHLTKSKQLFNTKLVHIKLIRLKTKNGRKQQYITQSF